MTVSHPPADDCDGLTVADVMHAMFATLPADATVGDARAWIGVGASRRLALIADDGDRYLGSLTAAEVAGDVSQDRPPRELACSGDAVGPRAFCADVSQTMRPL